MAAAIEASVVSVEKLAQADLASHSAAGLRCIRCAKRIQAGAQPFADGDGVLTPSEHEAHISGEHLSYLPFKCPQCECSAASAPACLRHQSTAHRTVIRPVEYAFDETFERLRDRATILSVWINARHRRLSLATRRRLTNRSARASSTGRSIAAVTTRKKASPCPPQMPLRMRGSTDCALKRSLYRALQFGAPRQRQVSKNEPLRVSKSPPLKQAQSMSSTANCEMCHQKVIPRHERDRHICEVHLKHYPFYCKLCPGRLGFVNSLSAQVHASCVHVGVADCILDKSFAFMPPLEKFRECCFKEDAPLEQKTAATASPSQSVKLNSGVSGRGAALNSGREVRPLAVEARPLPELSPEKIRKCEKKSAALRARKQRLNQSYVEMSRHQNKHARRPDLQPASQIVKRLSVQGGLPLTFRLPLAVKFKPLLDSGHSTSTTKASGVVNCRMCKQVDISADQRDRHICDVHLKRYPYSCRVCRKLDFTDFKQAQEHVSRVHRGATATLRDISTAFLPPLLKFRECCFGEDTATQVNANIAQSQPLRDLSLRSLPDVSTTLPDCQASSAAIEVESVDEAESGEPKLIVPNRDLLLVHLLYALAAAPMDSAGQSLLVLGVKIRHSTDVDYETVAVWRAVREAICLGLVEVDSAGYLLSAGFDSLRQPTAGSHDISTVIVNRRKCLEPLLASAKKRGRGKKKGERRTPWQSEPRRCAMCRASTLFAVLHADDCRLLWLCVSRSCCVGCSRFRHFTDNYKLEMTADDF